MLTDHLSAIEERAARALAEKPCPHMQAILRSAKLAQDEAAILAARAAGAEASFQRLTLQVREGAR